MKKVWFVIFVGVVFVGYAMVTLSKSKDIAKLTRELQDLQDQEADFEDKHKALVTKSISGTEDLTRKINDVLYRIERIQKKIRVKKEHIEKMQSNTN